MGSPFPNLSAPDLPAPPQASANPTVPQNIGYAGKGGKTAAAIDSIMQGMRLGKSAKFMQGLNNAERQYKTAMYQYQALQQQARTNPDVAQTPEYQTALNTAWENMNTAYENYQNYGVPGGKGKGTARGTKSTGTAGEEGQPNPQDMKEKVGGFLKRILLGNPPGQGAMSMPQSTAPVTQPGPPPPSAGPASTPTPSGTEVPATLDPTVRPGQTIQGPDGRYYKVIRSGPNGAVVQVPMSTPPFFGRAGG